MTFELALVLFLIICNGFFALSEMSVVTSRKARLKQQSEESLRAKAALELAEHPERFLSTVQVGITSIGILTGVFGGESIGNQVAEAITPLGLDPELTQGIGTGVAVTLITYFSIIIGELVPKRIALLAPEKFAAGVSLPRVLNPYDSLTFGVDALCGGTLEVGKRALHGVVGILPFFGDRHRGRRGAIGRGLYP